VPKDLSSLQFLQSETRIPLSYSKREEKEAAEKAAWR
jgi:hypothetical protein